MIILAYTIFAVIKPIIMKIKFKTHLEAIDWIANFSEDEGLSKFCGSN